MTKFHLVPVLVLLSLAACMETPSPMSTPDDKAPGMAQTTVPSSCAVPTEYAAANAGKPLSDVAANWPTQYQGDIKLMQAVLAGDASEEVKAFVTSCYGVSPDNFK